jgi:hypothetical protein
MIVYVSDAHAHVQRLVLVVKMATELEEYTTEEQRSFVRFCGQKDTMQRIFIRKCFLFMAGSFYCVKRFTTRLQRFDDDEETETEMRKWLRQESNDFNSTDFDAMITRLDIRINVGRGYVEKKYFFFKVRISHVLHFTSI